MMNKKKSTLPVLLLLSAFALALAFRLIRLGIPALSDMEAEVALQALGAARGSDSRFGEHIAYIGLTGFSFFSLEAGDFLARFWPAFVGALIVFVPFLFREWIGRWPAVILSFVLAISPEMVGISRIIGSPMMAFVFLLLALGWLLHRKPILSGICLAMGLMSGTGFWIGAFLLGLSYLIGEWLFKVSEIITVQSTDDPRGFWTSFGAAFFITVLVVGTVFFLSSESLSGVFSGLLSFIKGFVTPNAVPLILIPLTLVAYTAEAVVFGVWGGLRGILVKNKLDMFLFIWVGLGLAFMLLYPAGETADMIWVTLPLWLLSVSVACSAWRVPESSRWVMILTAVLVIVVSAFILFTLRSIVGASLNDSKQLNAFFALVGGLVLLLAVILLINYGWSEDVALPGLLLGLAVVCCLGLISVSVNSTGMAPEESVELWYPDDAAVYPELLEISIDQILSWNSKDEEPVVITVSDYDSTAMHWVLRGYDDVEFVPYLAAQSQPGILITDVQESPEISNSYTGQDLVWSQEVLWEEMTPFQYLSWLITRDAPTRSNRIIFWVRTDLMPNDQLTQ